MKNTKKRTYNGTKRPSLMMVECLSTINSAEMQLNKINLRGKHLVARHAELASQSGKTEEVKDLLKYQKEDKGIVEELNILKSAKEITSKRVEDLKANEISAANYEYPELDWNE
jgi:hypothetical protein